MEQINQETTPNKGLRTLNQRLQIVLLVGFTIVVGLVAYLTFITVRDLVKSWEITSLPGIAVRNPTATLRANETQAVVVDNAQEPLTANLGPTPLPWDGVQRVTVLAMGLDYRDWSVGEGPPRTDTMILLTLDPINHTAGMLSLPRDLWVSIPGYGYGRINTAYQIGEGVKYPYNGGAGLAMKTVEAFIGVPIDYYAQIDFGAFVRLVDIMGGVKLNIKEEITVVPIDKNPKKLKPGRQTLNGELALAYARTRKSEGADFDRADRTQEVILAILNQATRVDVMPMLLSKAPQIYNELSSGVHTNLNLDQLLKLGWLVTQIPRDQIKRGVIGPPDQVVFAVSPDGTQQVLKPITEKIRMLRDEIFSVSGPTNPLASGEEIAKLLSAEAGRVRVMNGTTTAGLAARTAEYLKTQGVNVAETDNAQRVENYTTITFYTGKPYTVKFLVELFRIDKLRIRYTNDPNSSVDISITLGEDWAAKNPMP